MNNKERNYLRVYYDEKKGIIKCKGETITFDEKGLKSTSRIEHEGINNVNDALIKFLAYNGSDFKQLVEDKVIRIDSNLLDPNYTSAIGFEFDMEKGCVVPKRIRRSALRELNGGYEKDEAESRDIPEVKTETTKPEEKKDDAIIDTESEKINKEEKKEEEKKVVKNIKMINWSKLKKIVCTGFVLAGTAIAIYAVSNLGKNNANTNNRKNVSPKPDKEIYQQDYTYVQPPKDETIYVQNTPVPTQAPTPVSTQVPTEAPVEEVVHNEENNEVYETTYNDEYSNIRAEGMEDQLNDIVSIAYRNIGDIYSFINGGSLTETVMPCNLELLVSSEDRDAVAAIMAERNYVVNNAYTDQNVPLTTSDVYGFLSDYVNYVYEGGTLFGGNAIKAYDYLDQYSQYIVNVIGQSMLQLYQGFEYASPYVEYSYGDLVEKITATHGELCDSLLNGRSY